MMECNKEEAIRARGIAEQKMQNGDFDGAKKFALKAQKLFPELENISQLLTVCNVHYCAKRKLYGSEMDWYGILQIEQSADESSIKKQYRKLALLLHPDKNKFAGAEAAFKLIGEANRILSDQTKRSQYDMKCRISLKTASQPTSHPSNRASSVNSQYEFTNNYQNGSSKFTASNSFQQAQHLTFWTICSACGIKYQYYKDFVNRLLCCPTCGSSFIARDLGPQGYSWSQFSNQKEVPNQDPLHGKPSGIHIPHRFAGPAPNPKAGSSVQVGDSKKQEKVGAQMRQPHEGLTAQQKVDGFSNGRERKKGVEMPKPSVEKPKGSGTSRNAKKRARKSVEESEESCETSSGIEDEDVVGQEDRGNNSGLNSKVNEGHPLRRSSRQKQHVSYEEKLIDDDDFVSFLYKRSKVTSPPNTNEVKVDDDITKKDNPVGPAATADICQKEVKQKASSPPEDAVPNKKSKTEESKVKEEEPVIFDNNKKVSQVDGGLKSTDVNPSSVIESPDPEFSDFEKQRAENCFAVNQVWTVYDTLDAMPRFYARVKKVFTPGFKLRITWLEPNPNEEIEQSWVDMDLPVSCGKYCNGSSETCVDRLMFSHQIDSIKGFGKGLFLVYPQKGETWALFRDWDVKWASEPEKHKPPYEYDFVEVLTDFDEEIGIGVAHLGKVKGFVSIFQQTERDGVISFQASPSELYRFSHRIPSFRMTGKEREGVPVGSFELDPASLPINLFEMVDPGDMKLGNRNLDNAENFSSPKFPENQAKTTVDSEENRTPMRNEKSDNEREATVFRRSTRGSSCVLKDHGQVDAGHYQNEDDSVKDIRDCNLTQPKGSSTSGDKVEKIKIPSKCEKNDLKTDCLKPRRSPRDLSRKGGQVNASQNNTPEDSKKQSVSNKYEKHDGFCNAQGSTSFSPPVGNMHLHERDGIAIGVTKSSSVSTPMSSPHRTSKSLCYDFKREKSEDKFEVNQIWALYGRDGMPKDYAQVQKIESTPDFKLHVALLEMCPMPKGLKLPLCCGIFKVKSGQTKVFSCDVVSHQLRAEPIGKNRYKIYPRMGDIWAIYKSWSSADSDLGKGECDIVEVLEDNEKSKKVVVLSCINGSKSLYRAPRSQRSTAGVIEIPENEFARFSHQIPAFQHTGEDSRWRGYWELDPLAIPGVPIRSG